jgi:hypothetical protein
LIRIKFSNELMEEEHGQLIEFLREKNINELLEFVYEQRYDFGNDVEEITFKNKSSEINERVSVSRNAVLTADIKDDKIIELMSTEPIGMLAGTYIPYSSDSEGEV